jgi:hypothetical protein
MFEIFIQEIPNEVSLTTIISILVGIAALGGATYKGLTWVASQNEKKAQIIKTALEDQARKIKEEADDKEKDAISLAEKNAAQIQTALDQRLKKQDIVDDASKALQQDILHITRDLKQQIETIEKTVKEMGDNVRHNFAELSKRADLTNGNVAHIRNDVSDLAVDIQDLFEMVNPQKRSKDAMRISREKDVRRRERKREIEEDRVSQMHGDERKNEEEERRRRYHND